MEEKIYFCFLVVFLFHCAIGTYMRYSQQLDDEFKKLGFLNFKEFLKTATPLVGTEPLRNNQYLLNDVNTDPENIGYFFIVEKNPSSEKWEINSIKACFQFLTGRNKEGVLVLEKSYHTTNAAIPVKETIRNEILEAVRIEKIKERFYFLHNNSNRINKRLNR